MDTNTLLVIGNGFDLTVGAKTSYTDYFCSNYYRGTREKVADWAHKCRNEFQGHSSLGSINMFDYSFTCWDLLFYLESWNSLENNKDSAKPRWCDIESVIYTSFAKNSSLDLFWDHIRGILLYPEREKKDNTVYTKDENMRIIAKFLEASGWGDTCQTRESFYSRLSGELGKFEKTCGHYTAEETANKTFQSKAITLVNNLCNSNQATFIDSFNYSTLSGIKGKIRHINGNCENPIFGIAFSNEEDQKLLLARRFTKTFRRLHQDVRLFGKTITEVPQVTAAIVFGHSLNMMDYDYFNYLFSLLKFHTFNVSEMGSIDFVFRVYDEGQRDTIQRNWVDSVYKLLNHYENNVSNTNQHILINLLRFSGKLRIRELVVEV